MKTTFSFDLGAQFHFFELFILNFEIIHTRSGRISKVTDSMHICWKCTLHKFLFGFMGLNTIGQECHIFNLFSLSMSTSWMSNLGNRADGRAGGLFLIVQIYTRNIGKKNALPWGGTCFSGPTTIGVRFEK